LRLVQTPQQYYEPHSNLDCYFNLRRYKLVDAADHASVDMAKSELHELLTKPTLAGIPLLVLVGTRDNEMSPCVQCQPVTWRA
jgi:hypothetical protein